MSDIEESNQAQRELQQLVDAVPQHIVVLSGDGSRLYANQAACDYHGLTPEQFLVEPITNCFHPDDIQNYSRVRDSCIANGEPWEAEARLRRKDGQYRWFLFRGKPFRNGQGLVVRWYLTRTDIEERKVAELELRRLIEVVPQYIRVDDKDGKVLYANERLLEYFGFTLEELRANDFRTRVCHPDDLDRVSRARADAMSRGVGWEVEARIRRKDGRYRWFLNRYNPLRDEQGNIVRWYATGTDIEDRKQAEREIQQVVDAVAQHIVVHAADGSRLYVNKVLLDYCGCTLEDYLHVDALKKRMYPDDFAAYSEARQRGISAGIPFAAEARLLSKDGKYRWFLVMFTPSRDEQGEIARWYSTGTDIEDRKRVECELHRKTETLAIFQKLVQSSMEGILAFDSAGRYTVWNPALERIFGISELQRLGKQASDLCPFFHLTGGVNCYRDALAGKGVLATDIPYVFAETGKEIFLDARFSPLMDEGGEIIGGLAIIRDVTERKRADDALRRSEAYLAEAQRLSHTGSWAWDYHRKEIVHWSPETYRVFGFDPANGSVSWQEARSRIHPDDLESFDKNKERVAMERIELEFDFRLIHPDGAIKHAHCVSRPVINSSGELVELVGSMMDVTEQYHSRTALEKAFEQIKQLKDELYRENLALKEEIDQASMFEEIVGTSPALRNVLVQVAKVAPADSTVLINGETGTGKELIARAIHKRSKRSSRAFVSVNCAAIPAALIGSELFGHERGAFTGATQRRLGRFELADGGTLFLDEVGDLPAETQIALLRVLQERQFERIGGTQSITVDVRIIAATNRDLKAAISAGTFRSDLFYRLNVFPIAVPPLRDRKDDIPLLVEYLIERYASKAGKKIKNIHKKTLELFQAYDWPGNIRELQNVIERAVILCDGQTFCVDESWLQFESPPTSHSGNGLARMGADKERELIESALVESQGRIAGPSGAAAKLGIPRSTLETKIRRLGIKKYRFNSA